MVRSRIDQASPATSTSTAQANRGGRPRDWTDPRTRKLARLYLYTPLQLAQILEVLNDGVWKPGKEAANKVLNHVFGNDPRWMRPKSFEEARRRIDGLKESDRVRRGHRHGDDAGATLSHDLHAEGLYYSAYTKSEELDDRTPSRSTGSSFDPPGFPLSAAMTTTSLEPRTVSLPASYSGPQEPRLTALDTSFVTLPSAPPFGPGHLNRQETTMTASTDFTTGSSREEYMHLEAKIHKMKITDCSPKDVKNIFRLFKRFTISDEQESPRNLGYSPNPSAGPFPLIRRQSTHRSIACELAGDLISVESFRHPENPMALDVQAQDSFGNTAFHYLAAQGDYHPILLEAVENAATSEGLPVAAQNASGQTLLHMLHPSWFSEGSPLEKLVSLLQPTTLDFYAVDDYGNNFFHFARQYLSKDQERLRGLINLFEIHKLNRRNAAGVKPMVMRRTATMPSVAEERPARLTIPQVGAEEELKRHTELLKLVNNAIKSSPTIEDNQGRNGLHALAEVMIAQPRKRKMGEDDEPFDAAENKRKESSLSKRFEFLETLLTAKVDVNHYNAEGETVLMAFVHHLADGEDDKSLEKILTRLVEAGARINARNRTGEMVLHTAVRFGQKFAIKILLQLGANPHARDGTGLGVLQLCDRLVLTTDDDRKLNGRLEACRAVMTTERFANTVLQSPTAEDEWSFCRP